MHTCLDTTATGGHVTTVEQVLNTPLDIFEIPKSALEVAAAQGEVQVVQRLLADGADPDYTYWFESTTPLIAAAIAGHLEIATALLQAGADVSISKDWGECSAIKAAVETSDVDMLYLFLEAVAKSAAGLDPGEREDMGSSQDTQRDSTRLSAKPKFLERVRECVDAALLTAAETGNMVVLQRLLDAGAVGNAHQAIPHAAAAGHVDVMVRLIQLATDRQNIPRETVTRALQCAVDAGHATMVQPLLQAGADAAEVYIAKSAAEGHIGILTALVQRAAGDDTVLSRYRGVEALHLAARNGNRAIVDLLLEIGTDVNARSGKAGDTAVALAVAGGHKAIVKRLIDAGADLNASPKRSRDREPADTALQAAARVGSMEMLMLLLAAGAHVDTADMKYDGWNKTALSVAAECDNFDIVAKLLSLMSPEDARQSAPAALERAVEKDHTRIVRQLLRLNIDVDLFGPSQQTLLQAAARNGNLEILKILVALKADVNLNPSEMDKYLIPDKGYSKTALQYAAQQGSLDAVKLLLAAGADVNAVGATASPILLAVQNGHIPVFEHLLAVGAETNFKAYKGRTIMEAATASGDTEMIKRVGAVIKSPSTSQEPQPPARGTGPLCAACRVPGVLMDVFRGKFKTLHPSLSSLRDSACAGCPFCCFLWNQLGITSIALPQPSAIVFTPGEKLGTNSCHIYEPFPTSGAMAEKLVVRFHYSMEPLPGKASWSGKHSGYQCDINSHSEYRNPIREDTSSSQTYKQIEAWLETCDEGHQQCQEAVGSQCLPTRLIYLDQSIDLARDNPSGFLPRLVSTKGMEVSNTKYIALSYRWPDEFPDEAKSTRSTVPSHMKGLNVSILPLSFNDLFQVAAGLKIQYVWIDSLCIIQDDPEDWNREAALMSQIYRNAYLTVTISVSQDLAEKRLFCQGEAAKTLSQRLVCPLEDGSSQEVLLMKYQEEKFEDSPLLLRGWCFQEREISRRILHYTKNQVLWECRALQASESLPNGPTSLQKLITYNWDKRMLDRELGPEKINEAWRRAVEDYSSRNFTKDSDKLPALAGLAATIHDRKLKNCRYLAGIWEDDILRGLAWVPRRYDYEEKSFGRYRDYIAPTWSWASVTGPVAYDNNLDRIENTSADTPEHVLQVLEVRVQTLTADPFGAVRHAELLCVARLLPAVLSQGRRRVRSRKAGLFGCMVEEAALETESGEEIGGMHFDVLREEYDGEGITSVFCVCLGVLTSWGQPDPAGPALAVVPTLVRDGEYKRVGIIPEMMISHFDSARVEEITII